VVCGPPGELEIQRHNVRPIIDLTQRASTTSWSVFSNRFKVGFSMPVQNCTREPMPEKPNSIRMRVGSLRARKRASRQNARDQQGTRAIYMLQQQRLWMEVVRLQRPKLERCSRSLWPGDKSIFVEITHSCEPSHDTYSVSSQTGW
jgi:hypothetical protein